MRILLPLGIILKMRFSVILIMFLLSGIAMQVTAQEKQSVLNLAGVIRNEKDEPLPFVKVTVKKGKQGDVTNLMGMFSIVVSNTDTIYVTAEGYQRLRLVIRDTIRFNQVCVDIRMTPDSTAETLAVFPYKTYEEFKDAVLKLQLKEDADIERARKNMAMIRAQILMDKTLSTNASFKSVMQEQ